jgi:predicted DNA-binding WGR domain protein
VKIEQRNLYFREGRSDKVYVATLEPVGDRAIVTFAWGRRGASMQKKRSGLISHREARILYHGKLQEKLDKGYLESFEGDPIITSGGAPYQTTGPRLPAVTPVTIAGHTFTPTGAGSYTLSKGETVAPVVRKPMAAAPPVHAARRKFRFDDE